MGFSKHDPGGEFIPGITKKKLLGWGCPQISSPDTVMVEAVGRMARQGSTREAEGLGSRPGLAIPNCAH